MKKKILVAVAVAAAVAAMTGCQSSTKETTAAATTAAATTAAETTTAAATTEAATTAAETKAAQTEAASEGGELDAVKNMDPSGTLAKIISSGKISMGTSPDFAPWEFKNIDASSGKTEYVGSDIELAKYIAERLGVELEIKAMEFSAIQQALSSGTVDMGVSGFAYTDERAEALGLSDFYNQASRAGQGILVLKDQVSDYSTAEAFAGKRIAAQNASLQQQLVQSQLPSDVKLQPVTTVTDGVLMLTTGKVDAVAVSGDNGASLAKTYPEVAMAEFKFAYDSDGNVIAVKKGNDELLAAINEILAEVNEKDLYEVWKADAVALAESLGVEVH